MRCLIITPYRPGNLVDLNADLVLCADTAYRAAAEAGIVPDVIIGDFDHSDASCAPADGVKVVRVPSEKDDTDTMLCIKYAIDAGADEIFIAGGIGGRLDHTVANLQSIAYAEAHGVVAVLTDGKNEARIFTGKIRLPRRDGFYLSAFAYGGECRGVSERGVKYPIENVTLSPDFPLGVSNEIVADYAEIEVQEGKLLLIFSEKE